MVSIGANLNKIPAGEEKVGQVSDVKRVHRPAETLPQTTQSAIFNVHGRIRVKSIKGVVTTVIQTQANDTKFVSDPSVGADVDLCAVLDITAQAVGTVNNITGTPADAMVATASGAAVDQAVDQVVEEGAIDVSCAASNTGEMEYFIEYEPMEDGAYVNVA